MTDELRWAEGDEGDTTELKEFVCSPPPPPMHKAKDKHRNLAGAYWEREVQTGIRKIRPKVPANELLVVGRDEHGIVAVSHSYEVGGPSEFKILAGAVALRARDKDLRYGDALMDETIDRIIARADAAQVDAVGIWGLVHTRNGQSQALVERNGFDYITEDDDGYQEWWQFIDLTD